MNSPPKAPWKDGRERSERWRETPIKGFPPRVSDRTLAPLVIITELEMILMPAENRQSSLIVIKNLCGP